MQAEKSFPEIEKVRKEVNERLRQFAKKNENVKFFDLCEHIPIHSLTKEKREEYISFSFYFSFHFSYN